MNNLINILFTFVLLFAVQAIHSEEAISTMPNGVDASADDLRELVTLPDSVREVMRNDMRAHLSALNEIIANLASNDLDAASYVAETKLGRSSMGKNNSSGVHLGRHMPADIRNLGWGLHVAATEFAIVAKQGDISNTYRALQKVTGACVACHSSYRTQ